MAALAGSRPDAQMHQSQPMPRMRCPLKASSSPTTETLTPRLADLKDGGIALPPSLGVTTAGTQVRDTFRSIDMIKALRRLDDELTEQGYVDASQRALRLDCDDIVVLDATTGNQVRRKPEGCDIRSSLPPI